MSDRPGEMNKISIRGVDRYVVSTVELLNELCDEKRFQKCVTGSLLELRVGTGEGLFTAHNYEHNWHLAHRILAPSFGPIGIRNCFDEMYDICTQLISKWARTTGKLDIASDFTRLTLDSIALCAMNKRFNSFYSEKMHPFVDAMVSFLLESSARETRTKTGSFLRRRKERKFRHDINIMRNVAKEMLDHRRMHPSTKKDLLSAMLVGKDSMTGERLSDTTIIDNMITFLIAGHETTSAMLSFSIYYLLKNHDCLRKAQSEVDRVVEDGPVELEHMSKLPYIEAVLRETLRLSPTAPAFAFETKGPEAQVLGGKYSVSAGVAVYALLPAIHRDPKIYGPDADEFKPERMYGEIFKALPSNAWKPFGNGARGCIGRSFAWQEAVLALALILQNFDLRLDDPSYQLQIKETLTVKPEGLFVHARLRDGIDSLKVGRKMYAEARLRGSRMALTCARTIVSSGSLDPITVLYGSNSGTCKTIAHYFSSKAAQLGYKVTIMPMNTAMRSLPRDQPLLVITSSYEGNPPDNAVSFVQWIQEKSTDLSGVRYAVFGCGHRDWGTSYQKIPCLLDAQFEIHCAKRIAPRGETNVALGKVFDDFDHWQNTVFWPHLGDARVSNTQEAFDIQISTTTRAMHLKHDVEDAVVLGNKALTTRETQEYRNVELLLPAGLTYRVRDYLGVLPMNEQKLVSRVLRRFGLPDDAVMILEHGSHSFIPTGAEIAVSTVLQSYVELSTPATQKDIATVAMFSNDTLSSSPNGFQPHDTSPSVLDILEARPEIMLPFSRYLLMLLPMRMRQYSISSSPLFDPKIASITFSVANKSVLHPGVASHYLRTLEPGSKVHVTVKRSHTAFHLPLDDKTPIIMACAGAGLAPFRGFIQERIARNESGRSVTDLGPAFLFIGCRSPNLDKLFAKELERAEGLGLVNLYYAYSQASELSEGCKYVQDRVYHEKKLVGELFHNKDARMYICGSAGMSRGITDTMVRITAEGNGKSEHEIRRWWDGLRNTRYAIDVFD